MYAHSEKHPANTEDMQITFTYFSYSLTFWQHMPATSIHHHQMSQPVMDALLLSIMQNGDTLHAKDMKYLDLQQY